MGEIGQLRPLEQSPSIFYIADIGMIFEEPKELRRNRAATQS